MSKETRKPLSIALGAAIVTSLSAAGVANAEAEADKDIFAMEELSSGYLTAGGHEKPEDEEAEEIADGATDTYAMTSRAKTLPANERLSIIEGLYLIALADGERCAFEDAYIRNVASLLHIDDVSRAKARQRAEAKHAAEE